MLRMLPRKGKAFLLNIFNSSFRLGYFPTAWKTAVVVPLLKPAKQGDRPEHYRPIALLDHMSKIWEKLLLGHLLHLSTTLDAIPPEQTGFRQGCSTEHHIAKLRRHVSEALQMNRTTAFVSLDCTQAFDSVSHPVLISSLREKNFPPNVVALLESYLRGRTITVRVGDSYSDVRNINCGVPQGSVLGPVLFTLYTADIVGRKYPGTSIAAYADDIGVYSTSMGNRHAARKAEQACNSIVDELSKLGIVVNPAKTDAILLRHSKSSTSAAAPKTIRIGGGDVKFSRRLTYLGLKFHPQLSITPHVQHRLKLARTRSRQLSHLLYSPNITLRLKLLLYKAVIRPTLMYGATAMRWAFFSTFRRLDQFQNGQLLTIARNTSLQGSRPELLHKKFKLPTICEFIRRRHVKFFDGLIDCPNPLFQSVRPPLRPRNWQDNKDSARLLDALKLAKASNS